MPTDFIGLFAVLAAARIRFVMADDPPVSFDEFWAAASIVSVGGHEVRVASISHLIRKIGALKPRRPDHAASESTEGIGP